MLMHEGLKRCGKSCLLRWLNYLRPDIKHGYFSREDDMIFALYIKIGSRWSVIASKLSGTTDNDAKNYWNTKLKKKRLMEIQANLLDENTIRRSLLFSQGTSAASSISSASIPAATGGQELHKLRFLGIMLIKRVPLFFLRSCDSTFLMIKDELDVYASETKLSVAKRIAGLRAVFGEVYPDPVRVVSVGQKLCGGTHISNTREAKAFALLSEEGIAKGIRRITAVTCEYGFNAIEMARCIDSEIAWTSKLEGASQEKKVADLKTRIDKASIPASLKADMRAKIFQLEEQMRREKKKIAEENVEKAIGTVSSVAEKAASEGKSFCICQVSVGLDTTAVREAVLRIMDQKGLAVMVLSSDETSNKAVVCAGVPNTKPMNGLHVLEWLTTAMEPLKGRGGGGKNGIAQGQGNDATNATEALSVAEKFALMKLV